MEQNNKYPLFLVILLIFFTFAFLSISKINEQGSVNLPKVFIVNSGSMAPSIQTGSIVVVIPQEIYRQNDIVTFSHANDYSNPITHRIEYRTYLDDGTATYQTSGDANKAFDAKEIKNENIIGKVLFSVPYLGYVAGFAKTLKGFVFLVIVPASIIIYEELKKVGREINDIVLRRRLKNPEEQNIQKAAIFLPIIGVLLMTSQMSSSYFSDTETSVLNSFTAYVPTPSPIPISPPVANHVVISEIQLFGDGGSTNGDDEFVELYNPTPNNVVMNGWKLTRTNSSGTPGNLVLSLNGTIPAYGYFLVADGIGYNGGVAPDAYYSAPSNALTNNYSVRLYSDSGTTLVDKVALGSNLDYETFAYPDNPPKNASIERKAYQISTQTTMEGGIHSLKGNGWDSNNNSTDFILRLVSQPQNSVSPPEIP